MYQLTIRRRTRSGLLMEVSYDLSRHSINGSEDMEPMLLADLEYQANCSIDTLAEGKNGIPVRVHIAET